MLNNPRLDRRVEFDERSRAFPIRALLSPDLKPRSYTWRLPHNLDQGNEGACVGFSITHELMARPVMCDGNIDLAMDIYRKAREVDEWPGEDYDGTSVLAGIKIATDKGYYSEYRWAFGLNDLLLAVGYRGPAILGINWYSSMLTPDTDGYIKVGGNISGGHAILCNGVSLRRQAVRLENSWGEDWGDDGACWLSFKDLNILLYEQGEACVPVRRHASAPWTIRGTVVRVPEIEKKEQTK